MQSQKTDRLLWQHPFVNIFKQFKIEDWKKSTKEGDVTSVIDKHLKCTVYKVQGSIPAGNYIQFPRTTTQSLGLTGRYLYILFKPIPTKYFVVHVDTVTDDGLVVRISFSNLFKEFKSTSTWLQFPFACHAAKGSVEHFASLGARQDFMGPAPLAQRWTMLVLDLHYILSMYINRKFSHMKNIRLCANILVKNCFTSDICYDPRLSIKQARVIGIKSVDENFAPMPREMNFFLQKNKEWDDMYDVVRFPLDKPASPKQAPHLPYDSIQRDDVATEPLYTQKIKDGKKSRPKSTLGVIKSPKREKSHTVDVTRKSGIFTSTNNMAVTTNVHDESSRRKRKVVSELPPVGLTMLETSAASCSDADATVVESKSGDIHVFAGKCPSDQEIVVHRHFSGKGKGRQSVASTNIRSQRTTIRSKGNTTNRSMLSNIGDSAKLHDDMISLEPNPILKLQRVIGFGSGTSNDRRSYRSLALWHPGSSMNGGNDIVVYAVHAVVIAVETANSRQHFFIGHTDTVTAIAFNQCEGGPTPCILASSQGGAGGIVRIWRFETQKCAAIIRSQHASGMSGLAFSRTGAVLVGVGRDGHGKTLLMVWNTSGALRHGSVSVIAKAHTDVEISRVRICPTDDTRMVTCGRDNIRFWRVRSNQLRSCPVAMPTEHKYEEIADVTFAPTGMVSPRNRNDSIDNGSFSVYACTKAGYIVEVDFQKVTVRSVHKLYPSAGSDAAEDETSRGISMNTLHFSTSYVATGSDDGFLRLWPLDLSAVFLEVEHEGPLVDIDITPDGVKVLASTSVATLGFLDVSSRKYNTIMRSHTDLIRDSCMDGLRRTISTCSDDRTIRVWDLDSLRQLYDFATPDDSPSALACHPLLEIFACGFVNGAVRVFHVGSTTVLSEHTNTAAKIICVVFTPSGERLISSDEKGTMTIYDTSDIEHVGTPLLRSLPKVAAPGTRFGPQSIVTSPDGRRIAFVGPNEYTVTVSSSATLDELLRIDVSTGLKLEPDILGQRPKVDFPLRVAFSPSKLNQLLVITKGNRLLKLDAKSGKLLSLTENMHRSNATAMCVADEGNHLVTAGDKLIKIWDYEMSKDISCQAFIGHSTPIHRVMFTPDRLTLITVGEDAIFMWDFLGYSSTPRAPPVDEENMISMGRSGRKQDHVSDAENSETEDDEPSDSCPEPHSPPAPTKKNIHQSSVWIPPDTLRTSDLDASNVSEFTVDAHMMNGLAQVKGKENSKQLMKNDEALHMAESFNDLQIIPEKENQDEESNNDNVPVKVAWSRKPKLEVTETAPKTTPSTEAIVFSERPNVLSHFASRITTSQAAQRTYAAPSGEEGMKLHAVIGYNGNGRRNLVWNPDTGVLAYTCGCIVILEKLASGEKNNLLGHTEEVSCLAMQYDGQILASASGSSGLVQSRICLWDTNTLLCRATLKHHEFDIIDLAYSRDDRFLISVGDYRENSIVVWSSFDGLSSPVVLTCTNATAPIHRVVWDPTTSNEFVSVGADASIYFWLLDEHAQKVTLNVHEADIPDAIKRDETNERLVHFTSACFGDDNILYIGSNTGLVSAWDTTTNSCFLHWRADSAEICIMQSKGSRLIVAGASRGARVWSLAGMGESRYSEGLLGNLLMEDELSVNAEIIAGAFDDTLDMGIVGTTAGTLWYLDWNDRSTVRMVTGHKDKINDIAFDGGDYFATCSDEGTVRVWHVSTMELSVQFQVIDHACICACFSHPQDNPLSTSLSQPKMLAAGYHDGTLRIFDIDKLVLKLKLQPHSTSVTAVEFVAENDTLLSGAGDGTVAATSLATGVTLRVLKDHRGAPINTICCSLRTDHPASLTMRDGAASGEDGIPKLCLICGGDRRVSVWDTEWRHDICNMIDWLTFPAPCFAPDGSKLAKDDKKSLKLLPPSVCYFHPINPDLLVYCGYGMNKSIQHYSLTNRKVVKSLPLPNWAECLSASPDGNLLAMGTGSRLLELVDGHHGTFQDFVGHSGAVKHVRFSPDGKILVSSSGCELLVWRVRQ